MPTDPKPPKPSLELSALNAFLDEFRSESDRAAVVLGAAKLDLGLRNLIAARLLVSPSGHDELLDTDRAVSTFSARIDLAYRLALVDRETSRALHAIRKIRNDFAHEAVGAKLDGGAHRDRVRELGRPFLASPSFQAFVKRFFEEASGASQLLRAITAILVVRIEAQVKRIRTVDDSDSMRIMAPKWFGSEVVRELADTDAPTSADAAEGLAKG